MEPLKTKEKGSVPASIIAFVAIIAVSIGSIYAYSEFIKGGPNGTTPEPTGEFETYKNEDYSFSLEYPADWILKENTIEENTLTGKTTTIKQVTITPTEIPENQNMQGPEAYISAVVGKFNLNLENTKQQLNQIRTMIESQFGQSDNTQFEAPEFEGPKDIERNGISGLSFTSIDPQGILRQMGLPPGYSKILFFKGDNFVYQMQTQAQMGVYENLKPNLDYAADSFTPEN